MKNLIPEFIEDATNVYRTRHYIVKQNIGIQYGDEESTVLYSRDTFYRRTRRRDKEYEMVFCMRKRIDGKRLPTSMYTRTYID